MNGKQKLKAMRIDQADGLKDVDVTLSKRPTFLVVQAPQHVQQHMHQVLCFNSCKFSCSCQIMPNKLSVYLLLPHQGTIQNTFLILGSSAYYH